MKIDLSKATVIGHIGVDSGQMMLVDPCYIESWDSDDEEFAVDASDRETPKHSNFSYAGACNTTLTKPNAGILSHGMAAVCSTGFGDGSYPVYVEYSNEGEWGTRIKSMTIVFIGEDEDEDLCDNCGGDLDTIGYTCVECSDAEMEDE